MMYVLSRNFWMKKLIFFTFLTIYRKFELNFRVFLRLVLVLKDLGLVCRLPSFKQTVSFHCKILFSNLQMKWLFAY